VLGVTPVSLRAAGQVALMEQWRMAIGGNDGVVATVKLPSAGYAWKIPLQRRQRRFVLSDSGPGSPMTVAQSVSGVLTLIPKLSTTSSFLVSADDSRAGMPRWTL